MPLFHLSPVILWTSFGCESHFLAKKAKEKKEITWEEEEIFGGQEKCRKSSFSLLNSVTLCF